MLISLTGGTEKRTATLLPLMHHDIYPVADPSMGFWTQTRAWEWLQKELRLTILWWDFNALPSGDILHLGLTEGAALCQLSDAGHSSRTIGA